MGTLESGLADFIDDDEDLARYLKSDSHFNSSGPKATAFMPEPKAIETSVFRHGREPSARLWETGRTHVTSGRTLYGAAIVRARTVREVGLAVKPDEPPPRHAVIYGWPTDSDPDLQKARQKEVALKIANRSTLVRNPEK